MGEAVRAPGSYGAIASPAMVSGAPTVTRIPCFSCSSIVVLEELRDAPDYLAGDLTADVLAIIVVAEQHLDRSVARELHGCTHIAIGFVERGGDRRVPEPMGA